jgi:hypothetical protein
MTIALPCPTGRASLKRKSGRPGSIQRPVEPGLKADGHRRQGRPSLIEQPVGRGAAARCSRRHRVIVVETEAGDEGHVFAAPIRKARRVACKRAERFDRADLEEGNSARRDLSRRAT